MWWNCCHVKNHFGTAESLSDTLISSTSSFFSLSLWIHFSFLSLLSPFFCLTLSICIWLPIVCLFYLSLFNLFSSYLSIFLFSGSALLSIFLPVFSFRISFLYFLNFEIILIFLSSTQHLLSLLLLHLASLFLHSLISVFSSYTKSIFFSSIGWSLLLVFNLPSLLSFCLLSNLHSTFNWHDSSIQIFTFGSWCNYNNKTAVKRQL